VSRSPATRLASRVRWIAIRGSAGALGGILVLGIGGRLVMLASRFLHPEAAGRFTENGNRIGEFTIDGTIALIVFGGLFGGLVAGAVWVLVKEWVPDSPAMVGISAAAIGGFALTEADNPDFVILTGPAIDLILLLLLLFLFGVFLAWVDARLERRLPSSDGIVPVVLYTVMVALGAPVVAFLLVNTPVWTLAFLAVAGVCSVVWWVLEIRGVATPPPALRQVGTLAVAGAVLAGAIQVAGQLIDIL
jgi:hypothetical protein